MSGVTNSLGITTKPTILFYLDARYLDSLKSVVTVIHAPDILTNSGCFLSFPQPCSIGVEVVKGANVVSTYAESTSYAGSASVTSAYTGVAEIGDGYVRYAWIRDAGAINHLGIYTQSS